MRRPPRSSSGTSFGFPLRISSPVPTAAIRFPATATASASGCAGLPVHIFALTRTSVHVVCAQAPMQAVKSAAMNRAVRLGRNRSILEPNVLDFFFYLEGKSLANPLFEILNHSYEIGRPAVAVVVDQIRVILRDLDIAPADSLCSHLLQKKCRRHLAFANQVRRDQCLRFGRQISEEYILEDTAGTLHGWRVFGVADRSDLGGGRRKCIPVAPLELEFGGENHPLFVVFKPAVPVGEPALCVVEARFASVPGEIDTRYQFVHRVPVSPGVPVHSAACKAGDACHTLQSLQPEFNAPV